MLARLVRSIPAALIASALVCLAPSSGGADPAKAVHKVEAASLVHSARRATAAIAKSARTTKPATDPKNKHDEPFFTALKALSANLDGIEKGLKAKDMKVFAAISTATEQVAQVSATARRAGVRTKEVAEGIEVLGDAVRLLRRHTGKEAARRAKGGELAAKEKAEFAAARKTSAELGGRIKSLHDGAAAAKHGARNVAEIDRLVAYTVDIAAAAETLEGLLHVLWLLDVIEGEWKAYEYYVDPSLREAWHAVDVAITAEFVQLDVIYVEFADSVVVESWESMESTIEVSTEIVLEVEITEAEFEAEDTWLESVEETTTEEYYEETATEEDADEAGDDVDADELEEDDFDEVDDDGEED